MINPIHILLVADELPIAGVIQNVLENANLPFSSFTYTRVNALNNATLLLRQELFDAIILALDLPDSSGVATFDSVDAQIPDMPIIVLVKEEAEQDAMMVVQRGAISYLLDTQTDTSTIISIIHTIFAWQNIRRHYESQMQQLHAIETRLQTIIQKTADAMVIIDREGIIQFVNPSAESLFKQSAQKLIGSPFEFPIVTGKITEFDIAQSDGEVTIAEMQVVEIEWVGTRAYLATLRDATERKELEKRLLQSQKMESIGRLAGGVAHDFNNLVTAILGFSELALRQMPEHHPTREHLDEIRKAGTSASNLIRQLLAFSKRRPEAPIVLNLNKFILNLEKMFGRLIGEDITLINQLDTDLQSVLIDPGQIEQILINLIVNAREAMPKGGAITIETSNVSLYPDGTQHRFGLRPGEYVQLTIHDTGQGIPEEIREQVFEPFYTTKDFGEGAGLGLATCYAIMEQNNGYINVESTIGAGSSFYVYFPAAQAKEQVTEEEASPVSLPSGKDCVLLVEDDEAVRTFAAQVLIGQGYHVLEAPSGMEALLMVNQQRDRQIDLLVTDIIMPQMSGKALTDVLQSHYPDLKVLFMTGYPPETVAMHGIDDSEIAVLPKPFTQDRMVNLVHDMLDA